MICNFKCYISGRENIHLSPKLMKKITLALTVVLFLVLNLSAQSPEKLKAEKYLSKQGELTFTFEIDNIGELMFMTQEMSLVNYDPNTKTVKAWANEVQFRQFELRGIHYKVPEHLNEVKESEIYDVRPLANRTMMSTLSFPLASYPTYAEYAQQMQDFEDDYPALVETFSIGTTVQGDKELLFVKISDNVSVDEAEPKLLYTATMHGDEVAGYPMMLTLINYILTVYSDTGHADHARVKNLVENAEIWINPNANPDGTYHNSANNTSIASARRGNGNNIDLNRNYPDNVAGANPDGQAYQTETIAFMDLADQHNFVISANFHGGIELVNYPFDNAYASSEYTHADGDWYEYVGVEYATNCQTDANAGNTSTPTYTNKPTYMTADEDSHIYPSPGVTHGAEWYRVYGGRQDYMNFYQQTRETTIELSDVKILPESSLVNYWYYNKNALLDYLTQGTYGFRGFVKDGNTNNPIEGATITIVGHDAYGSEVSSDTNGDFYRPIKSGTYDLLISAPCYQSVTLNNQTISDYSIQNLSDIFLTPAITVPTGLAASSVVTTSAIMSWTDNSSTSYDIRYREVGQSTWTTVNVFSATYQITGLTSLTDYEVQVRSNCGSTNSDYSSSVQFTTTDVIPCTGAVVSSYPYLETFNSGIGDWVQASGDDGDWSLDANGTGTTNTGPSDDITGGGNYVYTEASNGGLGTNATAILMSPCFSLISPNHSNFSFNYHMYGNAIGTLTLEISTDDGTNWTSLFSQSGNQGNSWFNENIDITAYLGETVKLRFIGTTGVGIRSDIAIDQIAITEPVIPNYCSSNGNNTNDEFINRIQLNTLDNNNSGAGTTGTGYSDFTENSSLTTTLYSGSEYTITITPEWPGTTYPEGYSVWIDYNRDGDFSDSGEQVWTQSPTNSTTVSGTFTLPTDVNFGETTMRVSLKYNGIPTVCESFDYGEVEDYTIDLAFDGLLYTNTIWVPSAPTASTGAENVLIKDGTYNVNTSISANDIIINSGAVVNLDKSQSISVAGNITNNGELILNSDSNEFSSLMVDGTVIGDVKYYRHVNSNTNGNDLISPPVSGQSFIDFLANNSNVLSNSDQTQYLFGPFEKPTNNYSLYANNEVVNLEAGKGYRAASADNGTFMFTGAVNTGSVNISIEKSGTNYDKWNLIGNPYTTYISLADFLTTNIPKLDLLSAAVYGYDADTSNGSNWTIWNLAYSDANPGTLIAPGQGFFVSSIDGGATISFTPSMRANGTSDDFIAGRNSSSVGHSVLRLANSSSSFNTDVYFNDNATSGIDIGYDAEHFGGVPSEFSIFSAIPQNSDYLEMAIQAIGNDDVDNNIIIPLGIYASQGEELTISLENTNVNHTIYLEDSYTNSITLLNDSNYQFTPDTDLTGTGRFYLKFNQNSLAVDGADLTKLEVYAFSETDQISIKGLVKEDTKVTLFDVQGRPILNTEIKANTTQNSLSTSGLADGIYIVLLDNGTTTFSKKLVIR